MWTRETDDGDTGFFFPPKAPDSRKRDWDEKSSRRLLSSSRITYVGGKAVYVTSPTFLRLYAAHLPIQCMVAASTDFTEYKYQNSRFENVETDLSWLSREKEKKLFMQNFIREESVEYNSHKLSLASNGGRAFFNFTIGDSIVYRISKLELAALNLNSREGIGAPNESFDQSI